MTKEQAIEILKQTCIIAMPNQTSGDAWMESRDLAIKALEQQPSDDCVSREKVHYMITGGKYANEDYEQFIDRLVKELENMPPVAPTFPDGFTNGDVMEIMFPNYKFSNNFGWINTVLNGRSYSFCPVEFWNSPYKRGSENGNN